MAFIYIRPQEAGGILYGLGVPWMNLLALAIVVSYALGLLNHQRGFVKAPQNTLVIGFLAAVIFSQLSNLYFQGALQGLFGMMTSVLLYFFVANLIDSERRFRTFIWLLILLSSYMAFQGIMQYVTGIGPGGETLIQGRIRFIGTFNDPNDVALALVVISPFAFRVISENSSRFGKLVAFLCLTLIVCAIWLTKSRGGMLSFGAVILFYIYQKYSKPKAVIIGLAVMAILYFVAPSRMSELNVREASAHGRIQGMAHAFWLMRANPKNYLFGAGYNSIADEYGYVAHNTIMHVVGETGLIGLFLFLGLIYYSIKELMIVQAVSGSENLSFKGWATSLIASFVGFIVGTLFLSRAYSELVYILIGCSVALFRIAHKENPSLKISLSRKDMRNITFVEVLAIAVAYIMVKLHF